MTWRRRQAEGSGVVWLSLGSQAFPRAGGMEGESEVICKLKEDFEGGRECYVIT